MQCPRRQHFTNSASYSANGCRMVAEFREKMQSHRGTPRKTREMGAEWGLEAASPLMASPLMESPYGVRLWSPLMIPVLVFFWKGPVSPLRRLDHTLQN
jgi:hypothetical protein